MVKSRSAPAQNLLSLKRCLESTRNNCQGSIPTDTLSPNLRSSRKLSLFPSLRAELVDRGLLETLRFQSDLVLNLI